MFNQVFFLRLHPPLSKFSPTFSQFPLINRVKTTVIAEFPMNLGDGYFLDYLFDQDKGLAALFNSPDTPVV